MGFEDGIVTSIRSQKRMNFISTRKRQGKPKPFRACENCLFVKDHCTTVCSQEQGEDFPSMFIEHTLLHPDVVTESIIGCLDSVPDERNQVKSTPYSRRVATQRRDGCPI